ncbi:MAG: ABC transporter permease [Candidatus Thermoplasmatota archaeon]|nr:ABC transporter permease [Candidatus Thermoplasmatota archaeon]MCL5730966.1 ABC transporter permease [Candidatus Thermoplasmatota archaeon]
MSVLKVAHIFSYYFIGFYRSRSFYFLLFIVTFAGSLLTYLSLKYFLNYHGLPIFQNFPASVLSPEMVLGYIWTFVGSYVPVFAAVFFGSSAISGELENKTAYSVFPLPVSRTSIFTGKYLASLVAGLMIVLFYYAFAVVNYTIVFHTVDVNTFLQSIALSILFLGAMLSLTFLISSIFNRATYAYVTVFLIYFLIFTALNYVIQILYRTFPFYLLSNTSTIISRIFFNFNPYDLISLPSVSPVSSGTVLLYAAVMISYMAVAYFTGLFIFQDKEVK